MEDINNKIWKKKILKVKKKIKKKKNFVVVTVFNFTNCRESSYQDNQYFSLFFCG